MERFVCLVGFLSSSITRQYRGRASRLTSDNLRAVTHESGETMTSVSAGHIILTLTQPVGSERSQRGSNPGPPHKEERETGTSSDNRNDRNDTQHEKTASKDVRWIYKVI